MKKMTRITLGLMLIGLAIFLIFGLIQLSPVFGFLLLYPYVLKEILGYGINIYLAKAIALVVGIGLYITVFHFFLKRDKTKRIIGLGLLLGLYISHAFIMYTVSKDAIVHPITGERKYCTNNYVTGRVQVYDSPFYDDYGHQAEKCNDAQVERYALEKHYDPNENLEVNIETVAQGFISPESGRTLFYYCYDASDKIHFYILTGFCPYGGKLKPLIKEVVGEESEKERHRIEEINHSERKRIEMLKLKKEVVTLKQHKNSLKHQKAKVSNVRFYRIKFDLHSWSRKASISFYFEETHGVSAQLDKATLKVWKLNNRDESLASAKQREPLVYEWVLPAPIVIQENSSYRYGNFRDNYSVIDISRFAIYGSFANYQIILQGKDANGHILKYELE